MQPLIVLLAVFCISIGIIRLRSHRYSFAAAGRTAMASMLFFTAIGHFIFTEGMALMIPDFIPFKTEVVYLTGILEIILGIALLIPKVRFYAGWLLLLFFILILPANVKAAIETIDYQKGTFNGNGINYLGFRVPLQLFFILWTYLCTIKRK